MRARDCSWHPMRSYNGCARWGPFGKWRAATATARHATTSLPGRLERLASSAPSAIISAPPATVSVLRPMANCAPAFSPVRKPTSNGRCVRAQPTRNWPPSSPTQSGRNRQNTLSIHPPRPKIRRANASTDPWPPSAGKERPTPVALLLVQRVSPARKRKPLLEIVPPQQALKK